MVVRRQLPSFFVIKAQYPPERSYVKDSQLSAGHSIALTMIGFAIAFRDGDINRVDCIRVCSRIDPSSIDTGSVFKRQASNSVKMSEISNERKNACNY